MRATVSTYSRTAAKEFESFLLEWDVEFSFKESSGEYTYDFDDQDDRTAFKTECSKAMGDELWNNLEWK